MTHSSNNDFKPWSIPQVTPTDVQTTNTNAINKRPGWKFEPPEEEIELKPLTARDIEEIRQAAYQDGLTQGHAEGLELGHEEGYASGFAKGEAEGVESGTKTGTKEGLQRVELHAELFKSLANTLFHPISKIDDSLEEQLLHLTLALTKSVLQVEVKTNPEVITQALQTGYNVLPMAQAYYSVKLNPKDLDIVTEHFGSEQIEQNGWQFTSDPTISRGGCDITTVNNSVDMTIERRMRQVLDKFMLEQGLLNGTNT